MTPSVLLLSLSLAGSAPMTDRLPWDGVSLRTVVDDAAGVRFPVPLTGVLLESKHFAKATPGVQMRHVLSVSSADGEVLELGVFENPAALELGAFVEKALPFLRVTEHTEMPWTATSAKVPALLFEHPRSGQQYARRTAVFSVGTQVFVVSCRNFEDRFAAGAFAAVLTQLEVRR